MAFCGSAPPTTDTASADRLTCRRSPIIYARECIHPKLDISDERIAKLYAELRKESEETASVGITIRNVESMIRMAEAHAKLHLRTVVTDGADLAMVSIDEADFVEKAHQFRVEMVKSFYKSRYFTSNNFKYDGQRKRIVKSIF